VRIDGFAPNHPHPAERLKHPLLMSVHTFSLDKSCPFDVEARNGPISGRDPSPVRRCVTIHCSRRRMGASARSQNQNGRAFVGGRRDARVPSQGSLRAVRRRHVGLPHPLGSCLVSADLHSSLVRALLRLSVPVFSPVRSGHCAALSPPVPTSPVVGPPTCIPSRNAKGGTDNRSFSLFIGPPTYYWSRVGKGGDGNSFRWPCTS